MSEEKKDPPGDGDPQVLTEESYEIEIADVPPEIVLHSKATMAYDQLKDIMRERKDRWITAFGRNLKRNGTKFSRILTQVLSGSAVTLAVAIVTGDPIAGLTAGTAFGIAAPPAISTTRLRRSRLMEHRRSYPNVPEFQDLWAVTAYEFMLMVRGYHLRVHAVMRLRKLARQLNDPQQAAAALKTSHDITGLLRGWHPDLIEIDRKLLEYQANHMEIYADEEGQEAIRLVQPLKDGLYDWLILEPELIVPGKEQELFERDLREISSFQDVTDAIDPYEALRRQGHDEPDTE
jgi:hypothetical protein